MFETEIWVDWGNGVITHHEFNSGLGREGFERALVEASAQWGEERCQFYIHDTDPVGGQGE